MGGARSLSEVGLAHACLEIDKLLIVLLHLKWVPNGALEIWIPSEALKQYESFDRFLRGFTLGHYQPQRSSQAPREALHRLRPVR